MLCDDKLDKDTGIGIGILALLAYFKANQTSTITSSSSSSGGGGSSSVINGTTTTTNATPKTLAAVAGPAAGTAGLYVAEVIGHRDIGGVTGAWIVYASIENVGGVLTITAVTTITQVAPYGGVVAPDIIVSGANVIVQVTGNVDTIKWASSGRVTLSIV